MLEGIAASPGYIMGKAFIYRQDALCIDETGIEECEIEAQIGLYLKSKETTRKELLEVREKALNVSEANSQVFDAHIMVLEDITLNQKIMDYIQCGKCKAEAAANKAMLEICRLFEAMDNEYMRERASDIKDVVLRMICNMKGIKRPSLDCFQEQVILVAEDLTPSDTVLMDTDKILGIIVDGGGRTSHTAIIARSLEIPAVVGTRTATETIGDNDQVILDGVSGTVIINPGQSDIDDYKRRKKEYEIQIGALLRYKELETVTADGRKVETSANVGSVRDIDSAMKYGADGVGLFRTEFLYMDENTFPDEELQFQAYKTAAEAMGQKAVIIRTLDIGGDKDLPYIDFGEEQNPFLGWRAIRMCLDMPEVFKTQLRAVLRASAFGNLMIMYPMIIGLEEVRLANRILEEAKNELKTENCIFNEKIPVGIMVETPAAASIADKLINEVDFFSIGTNDLTQYTLAVDRGNERIAARYQPYHPGVLRLIKQVIDASHAAGKWTGMCGELAGDEKMAMLLLGMGLDEFSMSPSSILKVRKTIRNASYKEMQKMAETALNMGTAGEVWKYVCGNNED